jgi:hypothetical protein
VRQEAGCNLSQRTLKKKIRGLKAVPAFLPFLTKHGEKVPETTPSSFRSALKSSVIIRVIYVLRSLAWLFCAMSVQRLSGQRHLLGRSPASPTKLPRLKVSSVLTSTNKKPVRNAQEAGQPNNNTSFTAARSLFASFRVWQSRQGTMNDAQLEDLARKTAERAIEVGKNVGVSVAFNALPGNGQCAYTIARYAQADALEELEKERKASVPLPDILAFVHPVGADELRSIRMLSSLSALIYYQQRVEVSAEYFHCGLLKSR